MRVDFPEHLEILQLPTPIHLMSRTTELWGGRRKIWIKRDDDTAGLCTGNKIRKLSFVVKEALDQGADTLVTCGGVQSNHCRATAAVARRFGMEIHMILRGERPARAEGNYFLSRLLGADVTFVTPEQYERRNELMEETAAQLRSEGKRPFVVAEGASMAMGAWGYIQASEEIARSQRELGVIFDAIVIALGSGGTAAGLELGRQLFDLEADIWAVNVCDDETYFRKEIHRIASDAIERFYLPAALEPEEIGIIDGYVGRGYALSTPEELRFIVETARREGVVLDPAYTGKAFYALYNELESDRFVDADNILFIHTGGVYGLLPKADEIEL